MNRADLFRRLQAAVGDVRPGEGTLVATLMGFSFFQGLSAELVQIAAYSTYWRLQLRERVQFTPDLQIIIHPSDRPHSKTEFEGGLRVLISL